MNLHLPPETVEMRLLLLRWIRIKLVKEQEPWAHVSARLKPGRLTIHGVRMQLQAYEKIRVKPVERDARCSVVVRALQEMGRPASVDELAVHIYGSVSAQSRNRVSVHLNEQKKRGTVVRGQEKGAPWRLAIIPEAESQAPKVYASMEASCTDTRSSTP